MKTPEEKKVQSDEYIKRLKDSDEPDARAMGLKMELLEQLIVATLRNCSIQRDDIAPFAAITRQENPETITVDNIYLPLDTIIDGFISKAMESVGDYLGREDFTGEVIPSLITKVPLDRASYAEGVFDALAFLALSFHSTMDESKDLFEKLLFKHQMEVQGTDVLKATGNRESDAMARASLIIEAIRRNGGRR